MCHLRRVNRLARSVKADSENNMKHNMRSSILLLVMGGTLSRPLREETPMKKCLLVSCNNLTKHSGGYCCAEHHKKGTKPLAP